MADEKKTPMAKVRVGNCTATIWENEIDGKNGKMKVHSVVAEKNYKDKDDEWKSTNSFNTNELPKISLALNKAFEIIMLKKQDEDE